MIRKEGNQWCVFTKDGSRKLGCHDNEKDAQDQLAAIEAAKAKAHEEFAQTFLFELTPKQAEGMWAKWSGAEHPHAACVAAMSGKVSDVHAFCAAVEKMAAGTTPAERAAQKKHAQRDYADMSGVEIFSTGTHNGDTYTEQDLDDMVEAFKALDYVPPLKAGHVEDKKGMPALGWIKNLRRAGNRLLADFTEMPDLVYKAIKDKSYNTVSSEIYWNLRRGGNQFRRALKAVALLGAEIPAVAGLKPLHEMFDAKSDSVHDGAPVVLQYGQDGGNSGEFDMTKEEMQEMLKGAVDTALAPITKQLEDEKAARAALEDAIKKAAAKGGDSDKVDLDDAIRNLSQGNKEIDTEILRKQLEQSKKRVEEEETKRKELQLEREAEAKRIVLLEQKQRKDRVEKIAELCRVPALRPFVAAFADLATRGEDVKVYNTKNEQVSALRQVEDMIKCINDNAAKLFLAYSQGDDNNKRDLDPTKELARRTKEYMEKHKVDYVKAMQEVVREDPALRTAYANAQQVSL